MRKTDSGSWTFSTAPTNAACAAYLERARWGDGFACPRCGVMGEPFRIATRPGVLTCRACRRQTGLTRHTPFYLVASQTPGMSAVQFQRQLGLTPPSGISSARVWCGPIRPGARAGDCRAKPMLEAGRVGEGRGVHHKTLVAAAVEVSHREPGTAQDKRKDGRYAGRVRLSVAADRSADSLCGRRERRYAGVISHQMLWHRFRPALRTPAPAMITTSAPSSTRSVYCGLRLAEEFMPIIHLVFSNLKNWHGIHHATSLPQ